MKKWAQNEVWNHNWSSVIQQREAGKEKMPIFQETDLMEVKCKNVSFSLITTDMHE